MDIIVVRRLSALTIVVHKHNMALIDTACVRTTVRPLLVAPSNGAILSLTHAYGIAAHILIRLLIEVEYVSLF